MLEMRPFGADGLPKPGGQLGRRGRTSEAATFLPFNADHAYMDNGTEVGKCWKIDSDLCDWLAASAVDGVDIKHSATVFFALVFSLAVCCCCYASCFCLGKLAYNLLSGYDLDDDGKLSFQELTYVLDEFIGDLCFTCTCPTVHDKKVSPLAGAITALETLQNLPVAAITFSVFTAIGVFILYSLELRMCLDCWDLAAAAPRFGGPCSLSGSLGPSFLHALARCAATASLQRRSCSVGPRRTPAAAPPASELPHTKSQTKLSS